MMPLSPMRSSSGLTVIEVVIVAGLSVMLLGALLRFIVVGYPLSRITIMQSDSNETARVQLHRISRELRKARQSDTGAYPLEAMDEQRIVFYANVDNDSATERVRYELDGTKLIRGITKPSGNPLQYDVNQENVSTVASSIRNGDEPIFTYYTGDYPEDDNELTPVDVTEVKYIQFYLLIGASDTGDPPPTELFSQVQLRNLKTNLGQVASSQ